MAQKVFYAFVYIFINYEIMNYIICHYKLVINNLSEVILMMWYF